MTDHGWLTAKTPKPRTAPDRPLGGGSHSRDTKPIGLSSLKLDKAQHSRCVDHVEVKGLTSPVCILPGQRKADVVREAKQLAGGRR